MYSSPKFVPQPYSTAARNLAPTPDERSLMPKEHTQRAQYHRSLRHRLFAALPDAEDDPGEHKAHAEEAPQEGCRTLVQFEATFLSPERRRAPANTAQLVEKRVRSALESKAPRESSTVLPKVKDGIRAIEDELLAEKLAQEHLKQRYNREIRALENAVILDASVFKRIRTEAEKKNQEIIQGKVRELEGLLGAVQAARASQPPESLQGSTHDQTIDALMDALEATSLQRHTRGEHLIQSTTAATEGVRQLLAQECAHTRQLVPLVQSAQDCEARVAQMSTAWEEEQGLIRRAQQKQLEAIRRVKERVQEQSEAQQLSRRRLREQLVRGYQGLHTSLLDEIANRQASEESHQEMVSAMCGQLSDSLAQEKELRQVAEETLLLSMDGMIEASSGQSSEL